MPKVRKNDLALTAKLDCDRFLRLRLASAEERRRLNLQEFVQRAKARPGVNLVQNAGKRWETEKYEDLLAVAAGAPVIFQRSPTPDEQLEICLFEEVTDLFEQLRQPSPPAAIIEGAFVVPATLTPSLRETYERFGLEEAEGRPDILWVRPASEANQAELIGPAADPEFVLHVIDVKMAAEPNLRHFTEVTFYALALKEALMRHPDLRDRYSVSARGFVWPGTHDHLAFRYLAREATARSESDVLAYAFAQTLVGVPHEIYMPYVLDFFENRLPEVLAQEPLGTAWHVAPKCQTCDFILLCSEQAARDDHLSRIPQLTRGGADLLRESGIHTTNDLIGVIEEDAPAWASARSMSQQLRADAGALLARARALRNQSVEVVPGRRTNAMPRYSSMNILLTLHFDPGSGLTFAFGARRVYFPPDRTAGDPPVIEELPFVVDRASGMDAREEGGRLLEFLSHINRWLEEADETNQRIVSERIDRGERPQNARRDYGLVTVHFFFWDGLEVKQLKRTIERHLGDPRVLQQLAYLARLFPPDGQLPDPDAFKSQPGTVVKEVMTRLVGLPIAHTYTLYEAVDAFHPDLRGDGTPFKAFRPYGFHTEMSDQIPYERAYELWEGRVLLKHAHPDPRRRRPYDRREILRGVEDAVLQRLRLLSSVVQKLRAHHGDAIVMHKSAFRLAQSSPLENVPDEAQRIMALQLLDTASQELENRQQLALPVDEREARFNCLRGLTPDRGVDAVRVLEETRTSEPRYHDKELRVFRFSPASRDARIGEREFTIALSNESGPDISVPWRTHLGLSFAQAADALDRYGHGEHAGWLAREPLSKLLALEVARLDSMAEPPLVIIAVSEPDLFRFALDHGLINLSEPLVIDQVHTDFKTKQVKRVLRAVSGYQA